MCVLVARSCLTLCDPIDCGPPAPLAMEFPRQEYRSGISVEQSGSRACILKLQIFPDLPCGSGGSVTSDSWDPVDCRPPGSSVCRISQARILEYLPFPSPGDLPSPGLLHCRWILYLLSYKGSPCNTIWLHTVRNSS